MEFVALEVIDFLVEYTLHELTEHMLASACGWSKRKWKKIIKRINSNRAMRQRKILKQLKGMDSESQIKIMDYVVKLGEEIKLVKASSI